MSSYSSQPQDVMKKHVYFRNKHKANQPGKKLQQTTDMTGEQ